MKRIEILNIFTEKSEKTGKMVINWEYPQTIKAWSMIGILETIKKELLDEIDEQSWEQKEK